MSSTRISSLRIAKKKLPLKCYDNKQGKSVQQIDEEHNDLYREWGIIQFFVERDSFELLKVNAFKARARIYSIDGPHNVIFLSYLLLT
jgi:hypothetical protein